MKQKKLQTPPRPPGIAEVRRSKEKKSKKMPFYFFLCSLIRTSDFVEGSLT
jgi:hypothetical protein